MPSGDIPESIEAAEEFDAFIDRALDERQQLYGGAPVFEHHHLRKMRVANLAVAYRDGGIFSLERTPGLVARAIDVKLQLYLTGDVIPVLFNQQYYGPVNIDPSAADKASIQLVQLSLRQDTITKCRILWDRIMGWVYFIETGAEDLPRSRSRSAKASFFQMCNETPRWKWMAAYQPMIAQYDDRYRTPELHKRSVLRARLISGDDPDDIENKLLSPLNDAMNQVWQNVESIVGGGGVVSLGTVHMALDARSG